MNPCVKFYRNITEWKWFCVPEMVQLIMYFVCKADHEPYYEGDVLIERGTVCISRKDICSHLKISVQTYKTCLKRLIADGKISTCNDLFKTSVISVCNFSRYVEGDTSNPHSNSVKSKEDNKKFQQNYDVVNEDVEDAVVDEPESLFSEELDINTNSLTKPKKKKKEVDCEFIVNLYHDRCPSLPKVLKLTDKRKSKIRVRFDEMKFSYETLQEVFDKCEASYFMRGDNKRGWRADFDWIFTNSQNWVKVLEGKYDNQTNMYNKHGTTSNPSPTLRGVTTQTDRNAINSTRQKYDILNTLAKCQQDYDAGNLPTLIGIEESV